MFFLFSSDVSPDVSKVSEADIGVNYWQFYIHRKERRKEGGREGERKEKGEEVKKESIDLMYPSLEKHLFRGPLVDFPSGPRARIRSHDYV